MGVPKKIPTPELMYEWFAAYKKWAKSNPILVHDFIGKEGRSEYREKERPLTMEGFEIFIGDNGGPIAGIEQYYNNREGRYEDFVDICSRIKREIRNDQIMGGMAGIYNPSITQRLNGLTEKTEQTVKVEPPLFSDESLSIDGHQKERQLTEGKE